jgi:hypothetical protein
MEDETKTFPFYLLMVQLPTKPYRETYDVADMYAVLKTDDDNFQPKTDVYIVYCILSPLKKNLWFVNSDLSKLFF